MLAWLCLSLSAQDVGSPEKDVLKAFGPPQLEREQSAGAKLWIYQNGTRIVLKNGVVVETNLSAEQAAPPKPAARSNYTTTTAQPARPNPASTTESEPPLLHAKFRPLAVVLLIIGALISLAGSIWFIVVTFQTSIAWGICCLFVPFASLVFLFVHWDESKKPLLLSLTAVIPMGIAYAMILT